MSRIADLALVDFWCFWVVAFALTGMEHIDLIIDAEYTVVTIDSNGVVSYDCSLLPKDSTVIETLDLYAEPSSCQKTS